MWLPKINESVEMRVRKNVKKKKINGGVFGELNYPNGMSDINLVNVSHSIKRMFKVDDTLYCEIEILDTPSGRKALDDIECRVLRPRGLGSTTIDGLVNSDYEFITGDLIREEEDSFKDLL